MKSKEDRVASEFIPAGRLENQLGFKMVKWIQAIEFVEEVQSINKGEGGYAEDHEYFGELAKI